MHYLFISESLGEQHLLLAEITETIGQAGKLETYRTAEDFSARLHRHNRPEIMILLVSSRQELDCLSTHLQIALDTDVILLVPDGSIDTVNKAHSLRPSYLARTGADLDKVVPVLRRLLEKRAQWPEAG